MKTAEDLLVRECALLCTYLVGRPPDEYVARKYVDAHRRLMPRLGGEGRPDPLSALAARGRRMTGLVDAYTRVFRRRSIFRRKLVLLVAILECAPWAAATFEPPAAPASVARVLAGLALRAIGFSARVVIAVPVVGPVDVVSRRRGPGAPGGSPCPT